MRVRALNRSIAIDGYDNLIALFGIWDWWTRLERLVTVKPLAAVAYWTFFAMPGLRQSDAQLPDEDRISGLAAMIALGGHAVVFLGALLLAGRAPEIRIAPNVVAVTLVSGEGGTAAPGPRTLSPPRAEVSGQGATTPFEPRSAGERLDDLTAMNTLSMRETSAESEAGGGMVGLPMRRSEDSGRSGSSRANQGLARGEGTVGVDLYSAASLPDVGSRPGTPPTGDLWRKVSPCWRQAALRSTTFIVDVLPDGALASTPQSVRRLGAPADAQTLLAERAAVRALQACAPYVGLSAGQWRVEFP